MYLSDEALYSFEFLCIIIMIVDYNCNLTYERLVLDIELSASQLVQFLLNLTKANSALPY